MKINRTYIYRMYPNKDTERILERNLEACRQTYNELLSIKKTTYQMTGEVLGKFEMMKCIDYGIDTDITFVYKQVLNDVANRLEFTFNNFFRKVKEKRDGKSINVGYPRFKKQYKSFTYPQNIGFETRGNKLYLGKIGWINVRIGKQQRQVNGELKTLTVKKSPTGKWFAFLTCVEDINPIKNKNPNRIGIDLGLRRFATLTNEKIIENKRFLTKLERKLKKTQQILSRRKKGSKRWMKARHRFVLIHEKIVNQRRDFHHQLTKELVDNYGTIVIEDLDIVNMVKHPYLAKHIYDASWGQFARFLCYKAESAGCRVEKIDPRGTSQDCSQCGNKVPKTLAQRWHRCPKCGVKMDRDLNASINILAKDTVGITEIYARGDGSSALGLVLERSPSKKRETFAE